MSLSRLCCLLASICLLKPFGPPHVCLLRSSVHFGVECQGTSPFSTNVSHQTVAGSICCSQPVRTGVSYSPYITYDTMLDQGPALRIVCHTHKGARKEDSPPLYLWHVLLLSLVTMVLYFLTINGTEYAQYTELERQTGIVVEYRKSGRPYHALTTHPVPIDKPSPGQCLRFVLP